MNSFSNIEQNWEVKEPENEYYYEINEDICVYDVNYRLTCLLLLCHQVKYKQ